MLKPNLENNESSNNHLDNSLYDRFDQIAVNGNSIEREDKKNFHLAKLQSEGLETLLNFYGEEKVIFAIKNVLENGDSEHNMLDVIKFIEPSKEKRQSLYKNIKDDLKTFVDFENDGSIYDQIWGTKTNFLNAVNLNVNDMQKSDSNLSFFHENKRESSMPIFASLIGQNQSDLNLFKNQLKVLNNSLYDLIDTNVKDLKLKKEKFIESADLLINDIDLKIQSEINEITAKFEITKKQLETAKSLLNTTLNNNSNLDVALDDSFFANLNSKIVENDNDMRNEIKEKTDHLRVLKSDTQKLISYF